MSFTVYIYMFTSHSPRNITAKNNYNYNYVHGVDGNDAASLEVLSAGRELLEEAIARVVLSRGYLGR